MKRLSDYKGDEAIELWADLLEPLTAIVGDASMIREVKMRKLPYMLIAKEVLSRHKSDAEKILLRIDPTPLDGLNIITRLVAIITDVGDNEDIKPFFVSAVQEQTEDASGGSPTESTEEEGN